MDLGTACSEYQDRVIGDLPCRRLQCDEIWSFCYAKEKNVPPEREGIFGYGDVYTWTAIDAQTKLVPCWLVGERTGADAAAFIEDLAGRLRNRVQLTTDGHKAYLEAVEGAFGGDVDYSVLQKLYGTAPEAAKGRYSPAVCIGARKERIEGKPIPST